MTDLKQRTKTEVSTSTQADIKRNAYRISLITTITTGLIAIATAAVTIFLGEFSFHGPIALGLLCILSALSVLLVSQDHPQAGIVLLCIWITLAGTGVAVTSRMPIIGAAIFIMVSGIALYALPAQLSGWMSVIGFLAGTANVIAALFAPELGFYTNERVTYIAVGILSLIYLIFILQRYPTFGLRTKLVFFTLFVVLIPLTSLVAVNINQQTNRLQTDLEAQLLGTATLAAKDLDNFLADRRSVILAEAQMPALVEYLQIPPEERQGSEPEKNVAKVLSTYRTKDTAYILSYALLDTEGNVLVDTNISNIGNSEADYSYLLPPLVNGYPYISPVEYTGENQRPQVTISAPVFSAGGQILGILRVQYSATVFYDRLKSILETQAAGVYGVLTDDRFLIRIVHTGDPNLQNKTYLPLDKDIIVRLQKSRRLPSNVPPEELQDNRPEIAAGLTHSDLKPVFQAASILPDGGAEYIGTARTRNTNWLVSVHEPTTLIEQQITAQTRSSTLVAVLATLVALIAAIAVSEIFTRPIRTLTHSAEDVSQGNLEIEAKIHSQDEIGLLASAFNTMTAQLREMLSGLEQRVAERTLDLERVSIQSNRRAEQLQTISEVTRIIAAEQNIDALLPLITEVVAERFGFYHVGIFLNDETNTYAKLRASNSEGGKRMLARGHRLRIGQEGIVGYVTGVGKNRIALDVGEDAVFFDNPDLPETRSEMALPLTVRGRVIGALDIQSTIPNAFAPDDANVLQILADQIAIAIENARLYEETRQALIEVEVLNRQYLAERWQSVTARQNIVGYYHSLAEETKPITKPVDREEIRRAVETGSVAIATPKEDSNKKSAVAVPVSIRGEVLATLHVQSSNPNRVWTKSEIALLEAVAERVGTALEAARLFEDTEKRAYKERIIGNISAKIGAAVDFKNILHTAVEELGRAIPGSEVVIQLQQNQ